MDPQGKAYSSMKNTGVISVRLILSMKDFFTMLLFRLVSIYIIRKLHASLESSSLRYNIFPIFLKANKMEELKYK